MLLRVRLLYCIYCQPSVGDPEEVKKSIFLQNFTKQLKKLISANAKMTGNYWSLVVICSPGIAEPYLVVFGRQLLDSSNTTSTVPS